MKRPSSTASSARRAQDTWTLAATRLSGGHALSVERELYLGGDAALLERLRALPRSAGTVVLVAHQPDMQDLALLLVGDGPDDDLARLREKFPTAGLAVIDVPGRRDDDARIRRGGHGGEVSTAVGRHGPLGQRIG